VDYVSEHQSVVYVAAKPLILIWEESLPHTRESLYDLGRWDQNVRLNYYHCCLGLRLFFNLVQVVWLIIVNQQMECILFFKSSNNSYCVPRRYPELLSPPANERHSEQDWTINEPIQNWVAVLIHWGT